MKYLFTILLLAASAVIAAAQEARVATIPDTKLYTELLASSEKVVKGAPLLGAA